MHFTVEKRKELIALSEAGKGSAEIALHLRVGQWVIRYWLSKYEREGDRIFRETSGVHYQFSEATKTLAQARQGSRCAVCGVRDPFFHHHHLIPEQCGDRSDTRHDIIRTVDNCVGVCENCHWVVHEGGKWWSGAAAPPRYYKHSHGNSKSSRGLGDRRSWLDRMERAYRDILGPL